ncbi:hypothetical protein H5410_056299 [Solanum commersonii]|uniref:Cytochrome c assembly protein domain-containing protein n=1 Tax=Solanum commersonii TaxID=4109 RepID=A0A9J5WLB4_SOLCO|nr:hypothetical protein H5410_056299 [Solanum commersonii]
MSSRQAAMVKLVDTLLLGSSANASRKITGPSAILTQGFATSGILTEIHQSGILVPALQSEWLIMHVPIDSTIGLLELSGY